MTSAFGDGAVDVADGLPDALAAVPGRVAVAQFERFALAGRRAGRHGRAPEGAALERHVHFDGRIPARIQDFAPDELGMIFNALSSAATAVGFCFELQHLLAERSDERFVIRS